MYEILVVVTMGYAVATSARVERYESLAACDRAVLRVARLVSPPPDVEVRFRCGRRR